MGYICIHGHFYQPPRENPWLEAVELQDSARPYHDWNERIDAECYSPNASARILDEEKRIVSIVNNYSKISFNFGPTLLSWIEAKDPGLYQAIREADVQSAKNFGGHGSAVAQAYNHMIVPLANARDRHTQVAWGIRDFEYRFGRRPEGMWLPETAANIDSLEALAEQGIKFTILAPNQAKRGRKMTGRTWKDLSNSTVDPTMAYLHNLPSGRSINVFFYDGPISRGIAFEGLLANGQAFAERLLGAFSEESRPWPEIVHIATDGESYGHHHKRGEMALAYALNYIEANKHAELINYGLYLERHPPTHEVEIYDNSSWSCVHGVERWRSNCGCNSGGHSDWNQEWRAPLRAALDWLRDTLAPLYEAKAGQWLKEPWQARNEYIDVILNRSPEPREKFLAQHASRSLNDGEQTAVWKLLELQRHAMLMYTSCGWFFDELSGIETVQVIQYAGRAAQLAEELFGEPVQAQLIEKLSAAKSNIPEHADGGKIYKKFVQPAFVDLRKVAAHYAIRSLFEPYDSEAGVYCYKVEREAGFSLDHANGHSASLSSGLARFTSNVTQEQGTLGYAALERGDYNPTGGVLKANTPETFDCLSKAIKEPFERGDIDAAGTAMAHSLDGEPYSLGVIFRDEQEHILKRIIEAEWADADAAFADLYPKLLSTMRTLARVGGAFVVPRAFSAAAEFVLNSRLRRALEGETLDFDAIQGLIHDAKDASIALDEATLEFTLRRRLEQMANHLHANPSDANLLAALDLAVGVARSLPLDVNLARVQNICYELLQVRYREFEEKGEQANGEEKAWTERFRALAEKLSLLVPQVAKAAANA